MQKISNMSDEEVARIGRDENFSTNYNFPSAETQTILRWLNVANRDDNPDKRIEFLHVILMPSEDTLQRKKDANGIEKEKIDRKSRITARAACAYLNHLKRLFPTTELVCEWGKDILPVFVKVDDRNEFLKSVSALFKKLDEEIHKKESDEEIVICSTGGYKAIAGFAMMYAQIHSIPCLYSFEGSPEAYEVMNIPLGYAYASLDEEISILKAIQSDKDVVADDKSLPRWVQDSKALADVLLKSYETARRKPYGTGEALFDILRDYSDQGGAWADYLDDLLAQKWSQLWLGDQIPETVEHSRRHSKRLMEFAANLFRGASRQQMEAIGFDSQHPQNLALLIASIYLHDIGHTALSYPILSKKSSTRDVLPLGLFPSAVREVHHLLTGDLLRNDPDRYFLREDKTHERIARIESEEDKQRAQFLATYVPLVAAHHRGYTKLKSGTAIASPSVRNVGELLFGKYEFEGTLAPLVERYEQGDGCIKIEPDHLLALTALLRIIDGCDVQTDRIISSDYLKYRNQRSDDEAMMLDAELLSVEELLPSDIVGHLETLRGYKDEKTVKEVCKELYPRIFWELRDLRNRHGSWRVAQRKEMSLFMALSLANRVAFKKEQHLHFKKHQSVSFVLPVVAGDTATVRIFPNSAEELNILNEELIASLKDIKKDIENEHEKTDKLLDKAFGFQVEIVGYKG